MKKILVVDDDLMVQKLLVEILSRHGYEVVSALDGIDAMIMIRKHLPEVYSCWLSDEFPPFHHRQKRVRIPSLQLDF